MGRFLLLGILIGATVAQAECKIVGQTVRCSLAEYQAIVAAQQQLAAEVDRCAAHTQTLVTQANNQISQCNASLQQMAASRCRSGGSGMGAIATGVGLMTVGAFLPRPWRRITQVVGAGTTGYGIGKAVSGSDQ